MNRTYLFAFAAALLLTGAATSNAQTNVDRSERVKDLASFGGVRTNQLLGY